MRQRAQSALCVAAALGLLLPSCGERGEEPAATRPPPAEPGWFEALTDADAIGFAHDRGAEGNFWFPEIMSGGGGWIDYDGDGDLDIYLVQGGRLGGGGGGPSNKLYRNDGDRGFVDVTRAAGVADTSYGMGLIVGDFDGDSDPDLYVTNLGTNVLLANRGDGTFERVASAVGNDAWSTSGAALDYDRDGDLDIFVVNYVNWSPEVETDCYGVGGARDYCHPSRYQAPAADLLLRNDGGLEFTDVTERAGLLRAFGNGLGVGVVRFAAGEPPGIYVANDGMPNQLWLREGTTGLVDRAVSRGCAVNGLGSAEAGMGVAVGDVDSDGRFDLLVTHLARETNTLYLNRPGFCEDATAAAGLAAPSLGHTGFGTGLADFDLDGYLDLWVTNGRVGREDLRPGGDPFAEPDQVYRGLPGGRFEVLDAGRSGVGRSAENGRGTAFADYDNDGDVDALVVNNGAPARLYRNRQSAGRWIATEVVGALGALVRIRVDGSQQWRQTQRAYSYCSSSDPRVSFGLGAASRVEELTVEWPDDSRHSYLDLPADRIYRLGS